MTSTLLVAAALLVWPCAGPDGARGQAPGDVGFCKPYTWLFGGWVAPPRIPALGDFNGDGYADFIYASPDDKIVDISLNGKGWKPLRGERLVSGLPEPIQSLCVARLGGRALDVAVLGRQGRVTRSLSTGDGKVGPPEAIAVVHGLGRRAWIVAGRATSQAADDIFALGDNGVVQVLDATGRALGRFSTGGRIAAVAAGDVDGDGRCELAVLSGSRALVFSTVPPYRRVAIVRAPRGRAALAAGDVDGDGRADLLVNGRVYFAPDLRRSVAVPGWEALHKPVLAFLADVTADGLCDVVVQRQGPDEYAGKEADCDVLVAYRRSDGDWDRDGLSNADEAALRTDPLDRDTDYDGLPDGWEVNGFAGADLKAMGASPLHKDILVLNLPYDSVPVDQMEKAMRESVVPFFARIPFTNLDGTRGFAVHWTTQLPAVDTKASAGKGWGQLAGETFARDKIGLYHWMLIGGLGGGGQSGQLADAGSTGMGSWAHEFGHQLGLSHTGKWPTWAPTYTSLMNYSYSYQFNGDGAKTHFSAGELAGLVLNESRLPGKVPYPLEQLSFLAGPPYRFHLKAAGPKATYVDWGWSGTFSDRPVRANITYGYSVSAGERIQPGGKLRMNYSGPYELMTDYQAALAAHRGALYMATANRAPVDPKGPRPASAALVLQRYLGKRRWAPPAEIAPKVTGDPFLVSDGDTLTVLYPTPDGLVFRSGRPDALGPPSAIPDTKDAAVSAVALDRSLVVFLYWGRDRSITYRTLRHGVVGPEKDLGVRSTIPPGATIDTKRGQLLLGTAEEHAKQPYRWQLRRFDGDPASGFRPASCAFVGGEKAGWAGNKRPTLIFNASREFGPNGRVYWIAAGVSDPPRTPTGLYMAQTIGYKDHNDGWMLWRYYDEWTNTRSGIGAAWFEDDIVIATTWASGDAGGDCGVYCGYNGTAVGNVDMSDFDDVSLMAEYGIARSIGTFAQMPP